MRTLLIDTCGDVGSLALAEGTTIKASVDLAARSASKLLIEEIRSLLSGIGWDLKSLNGIALTNGPGSFTGVRVGLACAKGLCEALGLPLASVSRLQVLAAAADLNESYAILSAGRGEIYVRHITSGREYLQSIESFISEAVSSRVAIAEPILLASLGGLTVIERPIRATDILDLALRRLGEGGDDLGTVDANYVRGEQQIYGRPPSPGLIDA